MLLHLLHIGLFLLFYDIVFSVFGDTLDYCEGNLVMILGILMLEIAKNFINGFQLAI